MTLEEKIKEFKNIKFPNLDFSDKRILTKKEFKELKKLYVDNIFILSSVELKYWILHCNDIDFINQQSCLTCGKRTRFGEGKYNKYCSFECSCKDPIKNLKASIREKNNLNKQKEIQKMKQTNLKKYGSVCSLHGNTKEGLIVQEKTKKTNLEKYGVDNPLKSEEIKNKTKQTINKYLEENPNYWKNKSNKRRQTNLEKYGHENVGEFGSVEFNKAIYNKYGVLISSQSEVVKEKQKQTWKNKYGTHPMLVPEFREKFQETSLNKFKSIWPTKNKEVKEKIIKSRGIAKYGIENYNKLFDYNFIYNSYVKDGRFELEKFILDFNLDYHAALKYKYNLNIKEPNIKNGQSTAEHELFDFIKSISNTLIIDRDRNTIKPQELDLYCPEYKFAIEYDGLLFHSIGLNPFSNSLNDIDKNYHLNKTELCEKQGIQLFHIFENEWKDPIKKEIWKSVLENKLHKNIKIYARKCIIKEISGIESNNFLDNNHLQGKCPSSINLGLFYNNELIGLMTFGKPRFNSKYEYELLRFCNKRGYSITGGSSKLLSYFINNYKPKSIISYANRRWSQGNLYEKLGFKRINVISPNFYWWNNLNNLWHRTFGWKKRIISRGEIYNESLTQDQNMFNNGYRKIYDCGNLVYEWRNNE